MRIVICDDEPEMRKALSEKIRRIQSTDEVLSCASGEELMHMPRPDILLLDICMPGWDGMEIARKLRLEDKRMVIIFITALEDYVYEAFDVGAFHYLVKPFSDEKLREVLMRASESVKEWDKRQEKGEKKDQKDGTKAEDRRLYVKKGGLRIRIPIEHIIYAEVFNRKILLHTTDGDVEYYGKLSDLKAQAGEDFFRPHRAYLINMKYVVKYDAHTIWLEQGSVILSKKQFPVFVKRYLEFIGREKEND